MSEIVTKQQIWKDMFGNVLEKGAELAQTYDMPLSVSAAKKNEKPGGEKAVIQKTAAVKGEQARNAITGDEVLKQAFLGVGVGVPVGSEEHQKKWGTRVSVGIPYGVGVTVSPERGLQQYGVGVGLGLTGPLVSVDPLRLTRGLRGNNVDQLPQAKSLKPHVDVSDKEPPKAAREKTAQHYACPSLRKYPLDGYDQIIKAASYFDEYWKRMEPEMRHEYCCNLVKRASAVGVKVSPLVARYGSEAYAAPEQIKIAIDARRTLLQDENDIAVLDKLAEAQPTMHPELFAETLAEFDRRNFLDQHYGDIPDAYFSTFDKLAADDVVTESDASPTDAIIIGNEYLPMEKLFEFSKRGYEAMKNRFGFDVANEFSSDPKAIFDSLPRDQKLIVMRMAGSNESQIRGATTS